MTGDELARTGVVDAVIVDTVLALGVGDPIALSRDERVALIERAATDGRMAADTVAWLRDLGILSAGA